MHLKVSSIVPTRKNDDEKSKMKSSMEMERLTSEAVENGVEHRFVNGGLTEGSERLHGAININQETKWYNLLQDG